MHNKNVIKEQSFTNLYKKLTNIVSAIILVVKSVKDNNLISDKIKELALNSLKTLSDFDIDFNVSKKVLLDTRKILFEIKSLLDILVVIDLASSSNKEILFQEIDSFVEDFNQFIMLTSEENMTGIKSVFVDNPVFSSKKRHNFTFYRDNAESNKYEEKVSSQTPVFNVKNVDSSRKSNRQNNILEFITKHKDVSIKDIIPNIKGCSEKTIQRELTDLVLSQKIKKVGDRRWTRYIVA